MSKDKKPSPMPEFRVVEGSCIFLINPNDTDQRIAAIIREAINLSEGQPFSVKLKPLNF